MNLEIEICPVTKLLSNFRNVYIIFIACRYYMLGGSLVCEPDWMKLLKNVSAANTSSSGATTPIRKGKVGRPRRSRD